METTFEEARAQVGAETQRHWSDRAIALIILALLGLFSLTWQPCWPTSSWGSSPAPPAPPPGTTRRRPPPATPSPSSGACSGPGRLFACPPLAPTRNTSPAPWPTIWPSSSATPLDLDKAELSVSKPAVVVPFGRRGCGSLTIVPAFTLQSGRTSCLRHSRRHRRVARSNSGVHKAYVQALDESHVRHVRSLIMLVKSRKV